MKKLSSKMKVLLVVAICAAMMLPAVAFADATTILVPNAAYDGVFAKGHYILKDLPLSTKTSFIDFAVVNGDGIGNNVVSSVKITLLDGKGKAKEVVISPNDFSQTKNGTVEFSTISGQIPGDSVKGMEKMTLDLKVGGPKNSSITLTVTEYFDAATWPSGNNLPPTWP